MRANPPCCDCGKWGRTSFIPCLEIQSVYECPNLVPGEPGDLIPGEPVPPPSFNDNPTNLPANMTDFGADQWQKQWLNFYSDVLNVRSDVRNIFHVRQPAETALPMPNKAQPAGRPPAKASWSVKRRATLQATPDAPPARAKLPPVTGVSDRLPRSSGASINMQLDSVASSYLSDFVDLSETYYSEMLGRIAAPIHSPAYRLLDDAGFDLEIYYRSQVVPFQHDADELMNGNIRWDDHLIQVCPAASCPHDV